MGKKTILSGLVAGFLIVVGAVIYFNQQKSPLTTPQGNLLQVQKQVSPSETSIEYSDPSGFSFNYPDNLSIQNNEIEDESTYSDLQLFSKDVSGNLSLRITDSKNKSLDEWLSLNQAAAKDPPKEVNLGNLKAMEVKLNDRLLLGALDQGILFTIEIPRIEEEFWMKVYDKILANFSFVSTTQGNVNAASDDVSFEGEEVVE